MKVSEMKAAFTEEVKGNYRNDSSLDRFIMDILDAFDGEIELKRSGKFYHGEYALFQLEDGTVQFSGQANGYHGLYAYTIELTHANVN